MDLIVTASEFVRAPEKRQLLILCLVARSCWMKSVEHSECYIENVNYVRDWRAQSVMDEPKFRVCDTIAHI